LSLEAFLIVAQQKLSEGELIGLKSAQSSLEETGIEIARAKEKIKTHQKWLQDIREPEDIELELKRTEKRLTSFRVEENKSLRMLALATGVSTNKLKKLPPTFPKHRSPANAFWD